MEQYEAMLQQMADGHLHRIEYDISDRVRIMGDQLGLLHVGSRDLLDLHTRPSQGNGRSRQRPVERTVGRGATTGTGTDELSRITLSKIPLVEPQSSRVQRAIAVLRATVNNPLSEMSWGLL